MPSAQVVDFKRFTIRYQDPTSQDVDMEGLSLPASRARFGALEQRVVAAIIEAQQAEAVAERIGEHGDAPVGGVGGRRFELGAGGDGAGDGLVHVIDTMSA